MIKKSLRAYITGCLLINGILLDRNTLRVPHFQSFKQNVQWGLVILIILFDLSASKHFHDHRKVLFFRWSLMQQIQHKCL